VREDPPLLHHIEGGEGENLKGREKKRNNFRSGSIRHPSIQKKSSLPHKERGGGARGGVKKYRGGLPLSFFSSRKKENTYGRLGYGRYKKEKKGGGKNLLLCPSGKKEEK